MAMNSNQICDAVATVADKYSGNLQVATKGSFLVGAVCGVGGILLGPVGLIVGGFLGGFIGMSVACGTFKSVGELITRGLTDKQREDLAQRIMNVVGRGGQVNNITNVASLLLFIYSNREVLQEVLKVISNFLGGKSKQKAITN